VSGSLLGSLVVTAGLGAVFWWIAARLFTPEAVGIAAGSISAMTFIGALAMAGTGTLLIRELPKATEDRTAMVATTLAVTTSIGAVLGIGYALLAPHVNPALAALAASPLAVALFAVGVVLTIGATLADSALLALLHASVRLARNVVFAVSKLALLIPAALVFGAASQRSIYGVWALGAALSLLMVALVYRRSLAPAVDLALVPRYARPALLHFALSMAIAFPSLLIPVLVALLGSPVQAAEFYVAWMLASVAFYPAVALTQSLFALSGRDPHELWRYARTTMAASFGVGILAVAGAAILGGPVLGLFGETYRAAAGALPIFVAVAIPQTVKDHYQTISRLHGRLGLAILICVVGGLVESVAAAVGFLLGDVTGLAVAWLMAVLTEGAVMAPLTIRAARTPLPRA
jgi:O-antigen/teichoic acid export membrane protein